MTAEPRALLEVAGLTKHFPVRQGMLGFSTATVRAVDGISFEITAGQTLGLVGESGCGKSTTSKMILGLERPTGGAIRFQGEDVLALGREALKRYRKAVQAVFQDPYASLDPRMRVATIVAEPLDINERPSAPERRRRVAELLETVGLSPEHANRYPREFSGGQRQRIGIARALALRPKLIVADEPVSALDVSIRAQILDLLAELQDDFGLTYVFVAHDIGVVRHVSDRIAVMHNGKIVEQGPADQVCERPTDSYTKTLLAAVPIPDPRETRARRGSSGS